MAHSCTLSTEFSTTPEILYETWLDTHGHSEMTGAEANIQPIAGAEFSAWEDYISGKNLVLEPGKRIVQSWRTTEFKPEDPDSMLEILLQAIPEGTKLTLIHTGIPEDQPDYAKGWEDFYFEPMKQYFSR